MTWLLMRHKRTFLLLPSQRSRNTLVVSSMVSGSMHAQCLIIGAWHDTASYPPPANRKLQEMGEYGDAIMTCVQCFQGLEVMRQLTVRECW